MASWKKRRNCKRCNKRIHVTMEAAEASIAQQFYPLRAYPCPYGRGYHLSTDHAKFKDTSCLPVNAVTVADAAMPTPEPPCEPNTRLAA